MLQTLQQECQHANGMETVLREQLRQLQADVDEMGQNLIKASRELREAQEEAGCRLWLGLLGFRFASHGLWIVRCHWSVVHTVGALISVPPTPLKSPLGWRVGQQGGGGGGGVAGTGLGVRQNHEPKKFTPHRISLSPVQRRGAPAYNITLLPILSPTPWRHCPPFPHPPPPLRSLILGHRHVQPSPKRYPLPFPVCCRRRNQADGCRPGAPH